MVNYKIRTFKSKYTIVSIIWIFVSIWSVDYYGNKLSSKLKLTEKTSIMATCTKQLHDDMMSYLH